MQRRSRTGGLAMTDLQKLGVRIAALAIVLAIAAPFYF